MHQATCSICGTLFEPHFSYQCEERSSAREASAEPGAPTAGDSADAGEASAKTLLYFCSQRCLEASHASRSDSHVACDACGTAFEVELAAQVLFSGGRRRYACTKPCRDQLLTRVRSGRLGDLRRELPALAADPSPAPAVAPASAASAPTAAPAPETTEDLTASVDPGSHVGRIAPQVLAVFNHKGGTGKTTTAVTVAAGLAERGFRVLLVDTDAQGNVAASLGLRPAKNLYHVLVMGMPFGDAVYPTRPGLDVLASNEMLAAAELFLAGKRNRDQFLAARLAGVRDAYDFVIVDCSPSLSLLNQNALVMADAVLCPVACDYLSLIGVRQVVRTIKHVNKLLRHPVRLWGVLPTQYDARAKLCHEAHETLRKFFGERCLPPIRQAIRVKEAPAQGKTLLEYAPDASATEDYRRVVDRLISERCMGAADVDQALAALGGAA